MTRVRLSLPKQFQFSTEIPVRITDINYGGHLGNDSVLSLLHEARVRFLKEHGFNEGDIDGPGLLIIDSTIVYKSQAFHGDILQIDISVSDLERHGCSFTYRIVQKVTGKEVARAKTGMVFYDYKRRKIASIPERFRKAFETSQT